MAKMLRIPGTPFLPGYTFRDVSRNGFHKSQNWAVISGTPMLADGKRVDAAGEIHGRPRHKPCMHESLYPSDTAPKVPTWLAYDKKVLCFYGYFKENLQEVYLAPYQIRNVKIYFYLEDDTIQVVEPPVENSGIPQGCLVSRQRIPLSVPCRDEHISVLDVNVNQTIRIFDREYHITGCDLFTRQFLNRLGISVPDPVDSPVDPTTEIRKLSTSAFSAKHSTPKLDSFRKFLEFDRKVLKFSGYWHDQSPLGDVRNLEILYFLADDTIEIKEIFPINSGRDGPATFLKRAKLPKEWKGLPAPGSSAPVTILNVLGSGFRGGRYVKDSVRTTSAHANYYTERDLVIGTHINVYGRDVVLTDCDGFTKEYYRKKYGMEEFTPIEKPVPVKQSQLQSERELPPFNGWGTHEDSEGNCRTVEPKAPQADMNKFIKLDRYVLRYGAKMISKIKENNDRFFVISYYLSDDTISVFELAQRNSGFLGGEFLKRTKLFLPKQDLFTPRRPEQYKPYHFYLGAKVSLKDHIFNITCADEFTLVYMEAHPFEFPLADINTVMTKIREAIRPIYKNYISKYIDKMETVNINGQNYCIISYELMKTILVELLGDCITEHEVVTVCRHFSTTQKPSDNKETIRAAAHLEIRRNLWDDLKRLTEHVQHFDPQGRGFLSADMIRSTIAACRLPFKKDLTDHILKALNRNGSNEIDTSDFINFIDVKHMGAPPIPPVNIAYELRGKELPLQKGRLISWNNFLDAIGLEEQLKNETK